MRSNIVPAACAVIAVCTAMASLWLLGDAPAVASATVTTPPWTFANVTGASLNRIADSDYRFDALWTDFNSDGCYDAFVFGHSDPATSQLWVNRCDGSHTFTLAKNADVHYFIAEPEWPRGTGWLTTVDFNGDGRQDFWTRDAGAWAARYVNGTPPGAHMPHFSGKQRACNDHCVLGDINGDNELDIIHADRSIDSVLKHTPLDAAAGTAGLRLVADIDGDSWPDLIQPDAGGYWHNQGGKLSWRPVPGLKGNINLMLAADFDNDGDNDLLTWGGDEDTGVGHAHLYRNDGDAALVDVSAGSGIDALAFYSWWTGYGNVVAADFDNDGLQDLLIAGASRDPSVLLLRNLGTMHFARVDVDLGRAGHGSEAYKSRASVADFDNDGRLDIVKTQNRSNVGIWRNTTNTGDNRWMKVRVRGAGLNSDGIGTDVRWLKPGSDTMLAHMHVATSEMHPQTWLHTGVGVHQQVDLLVRFPHGGPKYRFNNLATDQEVIVYANGCLIQHWQPGHGWPLTAPAAIASENAHVAARERRSRQPNAQAAIDHQIKVLAAKHSPAAGTVRCSDQAQRASSTGPSTDNASISSASNAPSSNRQRSSDIAEP